MIANKFPNLDKAVKFIRTHWVYLLTAFTILNLITYIIQRQKYQDLIKNNTSSTSTIRGLGIVEKIEVNFYIIKSGDTLWGLAEKNYSSGFEYKKIIKNNPGKTFKFEDGKEGLIYPGTEIIL
jgi:nucleoid-associated protein YgaU